MDFFDKAQDLLDKAQERVADATTMAAWKANKTVRVKAVQAQKEQVEEQIGTTTMQLGNRLYQLWKNRGERDDPELERLCHVLDGLLARYREVNADLGELSRATYEGVAVGPRSVGPMGTATVLPPGENPAPPQRTLPPASPPRQEAATPPPPSRTAPPPVPPAAPPPRPARAQQPAEPAAPPRPAAKPKPCPSCGETVAPEMVYCPRCGYMAR